MSVQPTAEADVQQADDEPVAQPLTLVMRARPEAAAALRADVEELQATPREHNPVIQALDTLKTVHFAWFVFIDDERLAVITTYDGDFERYIMDFVDHIGPVFDRLLQHMVDPPPLPVRAHREEFLAYVRKYDLGCVPPFYSAYPTRPVVDILADHAG
jgi:hypothetical protein